MAGLAALRAGDISFGICTMRMPGSFQVAWAGTLAANAAILLCGLATGILTARLLAPEGRGALAAVLFWPQLITSLGLLSLPAALIYRRGRPDADPAEVASTALWLCLILAAAGVVAGWLALPMLLGGSGVETLARSYLVAYLPLNFAVLLLLAVHQGEMRFARYNLLRLLPPGTYLAGLLALWALDAVSVPSFVWASWLGTFLTLLPCLWYGRQVLRRPPSVAEGRRLLSYALRLYGTTVLATLLIHADRFVIVTFWDNTSIGLYVVALTLAMASLDVISGAFAVLLLPRLAKANDLEGQRRILGQTLRYAMLLLTPATAALVVLSPWLIPLLFGQAFTGAVAIAMMLLVAYLPAALRHTITAGLAGTGDWRPRLVTEAIALATLAAAIGPLIRYADIMAIPAALLIANSISLGYLLMFMRRRFAMPFREFWGLDLATARQVWRHGHALVRDA